jgi:hypothetical protein
MAQPYPEVLREANLSTAAGRKVTFGGVVRLVQHEVARNAEAGADSGSNYGQEGEKQHTGQQKVWHCKGSGCRSSEP